jgi:uncharacterized repeat protein (TIGR03803 family)
VPTTYGLARVVTGRIPSIKKNGLSPVSGPAFDAAGNLYGNTQAGGAFGFGTVWELVVDAVPSVRTAS